MRQSYVNGVIAVSVSVFAIAVAVQAFTPQEQNTIKVLRQRITALETQASTNTARIDRLEQQVQVISEQGATLEANQIAMAADIDTLDGNQQTQQETLIALDEGMRDLVSDTGALRQLNDEILKLDARLDTIVPSIALTDITPTVDCGTTTCTVDVEWKSDPPATGQVEWGETTTYGNLTTKEEGLLGYHKQRLGVLPADGKTYHFRILASTPDEATAGADLAIAIK